VRVALTGGIATGKSTVARLLHGHGLAVVDADRLAREAVAVGTPGLAEVSARFGLSVVAADGALDRPALARIVFADETARRALERIVHPRVRAAIERFFALVPAGRPGVAEIPLAFETGWAAAFDVVVVVACHPETQRRRLMARDGLTDAEATQRLAAQWSIDQKARLADAVVLTDGAMASTVTQSARLADWLRARSRPS
jgi:dephospho-CoA kinase